MGGMEHSRFDVFRGTKLVAGETFSPVFVTVGARGVILFLDVDAVSGGAGFKDLLDIKVQVEVHGDGTAEFFDVPGATFAQVSVAGQQMLQVYPEIVALANKKVNYVLPSRWRVVFVVTDTVEDPPPALAIAFKLVAEALW